MASRWLKTNCLLASAIAFWLAALSPLPKIGKGISYSLAIVAVVQLVQESRRLMISDARRGALQAMNQELEQVEIALHTQQQEQALYEIYGAPTYTPEVKDELTKSLEHLYTEGSAEQTTSTSTSTSQKMVYLAVKALLESGCNETYIIEKVLKKGGRNWEEGHRMLQELLQLGKQNEW
ncbi:hypothetical protein H6G81_34810 [Scytonema hofmannii FACHB-248]|uniref:Uncharacterized protein n=1 Tax=Scytonema hofmannii FACHB-248 TaxID=1842502 RepID=A0ABR8H1Y3_9CYAN|nr:MULTISPECIES: hypothetical protein [Nostocales]MBD2609524.1 hypothetical protein [Scytonema hofmannii FACHB-248]